MRFSLLLGPAIGSVCSLGHIPLSPEGADNQESDAGKRCRPSATRRSATTASADTLTILQPDDWHLHVRDGAGLKSVVPHTARHFARAIIMPNLVPPVTKATQVNSEFICSTSSAQHPCTAAKLAADAGIIMILVVGSDAGVAIQAKNPGCCS